MNIHEYQAKNLLRDYGVPVSNGVIIFSVDEIDEKINFGLEINHSLLKDFQNKVQHFNFIFATGINLINQFFILDNKLNSKISKNLFKILNKNKIFKNYLTIFADKGINLNY